MTAEATSDRARPSYEYDVFISYASEDRSFVQKLVVGLNGLKIFWDRDFAPGGWIVENIGDAIEGARFTLLILTPAWVSSEFTQMEFYVAMNKALADRSRTVIPLLVEPCALPRVLKDMTYLSFIDVSFEEQTGRLIDVLSPRESRPMPEPVQAAESGSGFDAVADAAGDSALKAAVIDCYSDVSRNIDVMADLKELHNELHKLQSAHDLIASAIRPFFKNDEPLVSSDGEDVTGEIEDEQVLAILSEKAQDIKASIDVVVSIKTQRNIPHHFLWLTTLQTAHDNLLRGIRSRELRTIRSAARAIERVLMTQPSQVNRALVDMARTLGLRRLRMTIENVYRHARADGHGDLDEIAQAAAAVEKFRRRVSALVDDHDLWQVADVEWRPLEARHMLWFDDLLEAWPGVKKGLEAMLRTEEPWAQEIARTRDEVDQAIALENKGGAYIAFRVLRRQAVLRFMQVDSQLHEQCKELRFVGRQLAAISGALS